MNSLPRNSSTGALAKTSAVASRRPILTAALAAGMLAVVGALTTDLSPWYYSLKRPALQPPDWLFGPAWTLIFSLAAASGYLAWKSRPNLRAWARIASLFGVNGILNVLWSALYFRLHRPDWALAEVFALWLSIAVLIVAMAPHTRTGAFLLVPYLLWVSFAAYLNWAVVRLNYPF